MSTIIWGLLPEDAQILLKEAAATVVDSRKKDVVTAVRAGVIDAAVREIKWKYPEYFRQEAL